MTETKFFSPDDIPAVAIDGRDRGFFILDDELLEDVTLTIYDRAVYMVVVKHATRNGSRAGQCKLKNETIAREAGCSSRQVRASLARLKENKQPYAETPWISVFPIKGAGGQTSNVYLVLPVGKKPKPQPVVPESPISTTDSGGRHTMPGGAAPYAGRAAYHAAITRGSNNQTFSEQEVEDSKTAVADAPAPSRSLFPDSPSPKKAKPKEQDDPELQACCKVVYDDFHAANPDTTLDFHKAIRGPVKRLRAEVPSLTADALKAMCANRRASPGVKHGELPKIYLGYITNFKNGPLSQFGKEQTLDVRTSARTAEQKQARSIDAIKAAASRMAGTAIGNREGVLPRA